MYGCCKPLPYDKAPQTFVGVYYSLPSSFAGSATTPYLLEQTGAAPGHLDVLSVVAVLGSHEPVLAFLSSRPQRLVRTGLLRGGAGVAAGPAVVTS